MLDQATKLRSLVLRTARRKRAEGDPPPRLVVLTGGKSGVGVTTLAVNLSAALVDQALRVVLIDADAYRADVASLCRLPERADVGDILTARRDIHEVLQRGPGGILVVPGIGGLDHEVALDLDGQQRLLKHLRLLAPHADVVVLDIGSAAPQAMDRFWKAADEILVVTTPDAVSIMDCYATIKTGLAARGDLDPAPRLIVNRTEHARQAEDVHQRIDLSARRFLRREIPYLGCLPNEPRVSELVDQGKLLVLSDRHNAASTAMMDLATRFAPMLSASAPMSASDVA